MMATAREIKRPFLEVSTNVEWIRLYSCADFDDVDEMDEDAAAATFSDALFVALEDAGFETGHTPAPRITCHGWNGANTFRHKRGPVGTFDELTADQVDAIDSAYFDAADVMAAKWAKLHEATGE